MPGEERNKRGSRSRTPWRSAAPALLSALVLSLLVAAPASAGSWLGAVPLSGPGRDASNPALAMDAAGEAIAIWEKEEFAHPKQNLEYSVHVPGSGFSAPIEIASHGLKPDIGMTPGGETIAVWHRLDLALGTNVIEAATRPPGGTFSAPEIIYVVPDGVIPQEVDLAIGPTGDAAVVWTEFDPHSPLHELHCPSPPTTPDPLCPNPFFVMASFRPQGGQFGTPKRISPPRERNAHPPESAEEELEREREESFETAFEARVAVGPSGRAVAVWSFFEGGTDVLQWAAVEPGAHEFGPPANVSAIGKNAVSPSVGMDAAGNATVVWSATEGSDQVIRAAARPPGGAFSDLGAISPAPGLSAVPSLAVNAGGTATAAWHLSNGAEAFLQTSTRPPGGSFAPPGVISNPSDLPQAPQVAINDAGEAVVVWSGPNLTGQATIASVRGPGGTFGPAEPISPTSVKSFHPVVAMDAQGDAVAVWTRDDGSDDVAEYAGYDADSPALRDVAVPPVGTVGQQLAMSARPEDAWAVGPPTFEFGDGASATGGSVSHSYSRPGSYSVGISAMDAGGARTAESRTILIKARNQFTIEKLVRNRKKGTATLFVHVLEPGEVTISGKGIRRASSKTRTGGTLKVPVAASGKALKRLKRRGKLKARLRVSYLPDGGDPNSAAYRLKLLKKHG